MSIFWARRPRGAHLVGPPYEVRDAQHARQACQKAEHAKESGGLRSQHPGQSKGEGCNRGGQQDHKCGRRSRHLRVDTELEQQGRDDHPPGDAEKACSKRSVPFKVALLSMQDG